MTRTLLLALMFSSFNTLVLAQDEGANGAVQVVLPGTPRGKPRTGPIEARRPTPQPELLRQRLAALATPAEIDRVTHPIRSGDPSPEQEPPAPRTREDELRDLAKNYLGVLDLLREAPELFDRAKTLFSGTRGVDLLREALGETTLDDVELVRLNHRFLNSLDQASIADDPPEALGSLRDEYAAPYAPEMLDFYTQKFINKNQRHRWRDPRTGTVIDVPGHLFVPSYELIPYGHVPATHRRP